MTRTTRHAGRFGSALAQTNKTRLDPFGLAALRFGRPFGLAFTVLEMGYPRIRLYFLPGILFIYEAFPFVTRFVTKYQKERFSI